MTKRIILTIDDLKELAAHCYDEFRRDNPAFRLWKEFGLIHPGLRMMWLRVALQANSIERGSDIPIEVQAYHLWKAQWPQPWRAAVEDCDRPPEMSSDAWKHHVERYWAGWERVAHVLHQVLFVDQRLQPTYDQL